MNEPRVRKDGLCAHCRGPRKLSGLKKLYRTQAERDSFCSRGCCEAWYAKQRAKALSQGIATFGAGAPRKTELAGSAGR